MLLNFSAINHQQCNSLFIHTGQEFNRNYMIPRRHEDFQSPEGDYNTGRNHPIRSQLFHNVPSNVYEEKFYGYSNAQTSNTYANSPQRPYGNNREGMRGRHTGFAGGRGAGNSYSNQTQDTCNDDDSNYNQSYNNPSYSNPNVNNTPFNYPNKPKFSNNKADNNQIGTSKYGGGIFNNEKPSGRGRPAIKRTFENSYKNYAACKCFSFILNFYCWLFLCLLLGT